MGRIPLRRRHVRQFLMYSAAALVLAVAIVDAVSSSKASGERGSLSKADKQAEAEKRRQKKRMYSLFDHIIWICLYAFLSAVFAGLTLGVMCADTFTLEIIAESGHAPDCKYAATILPLRKQGHKTLCTLIVSNMLCNVLIVQQFSEFFDIIYSIRTHGNTSNVVDDSGSQLLNFLVSTTVIVIFAEILPMSICKSKHSLRVAAAGSIFVRIAMVVTSPVSAPLGIFLDWVVGSKESGQIYDRNELRKLMVLHYSQEGDNANMPNSELNLLLAAMDFQERRVKDIMTPIERATFVRETDIVTPDFVERVWLSGRSRVPVASATGDYFSDVLVVKDLLTVSISPDEEPLTVAQVIKARNRLFAMVGENTTLPAMLKFFQDAQTHMAVVFAEEPEAGASRTAETPADLTSSAGAPGAAAAGAMESDSPVPDAPTRDDAERVAMDLSSSIRRSFARQPNLVHTQSAVRTVGIVTMEDVVEELLNDEIYDEYDRYDPDPGAKSIQAGGSPNSSTVNLFREHAQTPTSDPHVQGIVVPPEPTKPPRVNFYSYFTHPEANVPLTEAQVWAVAYFLNRTVKAFMLWPPAYIKLLLDDCGDQQLVAPAAHRAGSLAEVSHPSLSAGAATAAAASSTPNGSPTLPAPTTDLRSEHTLEGSVALSGSPTGGPVGRADDLPTGRPAHRYDHENFLRQAASEDFVIYAINKPADSFTLVLGGQVDVLVGSEKFYSRLRSFQFIGEEALTETFYAPDFSAIVSRAARIYRIRKDRYEQYLSYQTVRQRLQSHLRVLRTPHSTMNLSTLGSTAAAPSGPRPPPPAGTRVGGGGGSRSRSGKVLTDEGGGVSERDLLLRRTFSEGALQVTHNPVSKAYGTFAPEKY